MRANDASFTGMQRILQRMSERDQLQLDDRTADRLLECTMSFDDAPPRYQRVALALDALTRPATDAETAGQAAAVASIAARVQFRAASISSAGKPARPKRRFAQLVTASLVGGLTLLGGLAAANALPGAVQGVASDMLDQVGVSVPAPSSPDDSHPGPDDSHPGVRGQSGDHTADPASQGGDHGSDVSNHAHTKPSTAGDNGEATSSEASNGKSHAGQQSPHDATVPSNGPPVDPPNKGGNSSAGSDNAANGHGKKP